LVHHVYEADPISGPVISPQAKERIENLIQTVTDEGGIIHLDGRGCVVENYPEGNFVGPTVVECTTDMSAYK
jgi:malonate-semialdehyde dehydrogenase (acetylating)/methylmalonate-semialdehyde dehydrogenase